MTEPDWPRIHRDFRELVTLWLDDAARDEELEAPVERFSNYGRNGTYVAAGYTGQVMLTITGDHRLARRLAHDLHRSLPPDADLDRQSMRPVAMRILSAVLADHPDAERLERAMDRDGAVVRGDWVNFILIGLLRMAFQVHAQQRPGVGTPSQQWNSS